MRGFSTFIRIALAAFVVATASAQSASSNDALFAALRRGDVADVERLLAGGASPNALDTDGTPALMAATLFGDARVVDLLLKRGADPNKSDASGATALMWAVSDIDKVRLLLARGADVAAKANTGRTALLVASAFPGTVDVLRLLLDRGADVRAQDGAGTTALAFAVRASDVDVVRLLVERGLDPNALSPPARRAAFVRHDLPTTNYLMSMKLGFTPDVLMAASMWQPARDGRPLARARGRREPDFAAGAVRENRSTDGRHLGRPGRRRAANPARAWRRPERAEH